MIIYIEKGNGLHKAIRVAGHRLEQRDGVWMSSDDITVQSIIDSYDPLEDYKVIKIDELKLEGLFRLSAIFPAISSVDEVQFQSEFWLSIIPAARSATPDFQKAIDIYTAAKNATIIINGFSDTGSVNAYDVVNDPGWSV